MSKPAQRPPKRPPKSSPGPAETTMEVLTELLLAAMSAAAGFVVLFILMITRVLPDTESAAWSGIIAGPIWVGTTGLVYLTLERRIDRGEPVSEPLWSARGKGERAGVGLGLVLALGGVLAAILGSMVLGLAQELLFSAEVEEQQLILELVARGDPFELALLAVSAVVLAPITEELVFRHMLFRRLLHRAGPTLAWTLPALAFALVHWNPIGLVVYVWLGTVFAMAYWLSGRLWVAMLVHAGHNAFALSMLLWMPEALP